MTQNASEMGGAASETLPRSNRGVIFGTRASGALALPPKIRAFLGERGIAADVRVYRNQARVREYFFGLTYDSTQADRTLPAWVVAYPEMRDPDTSLGSTVPIPNRVQELCDQYEVPLVRVSPEDSRNVEELARQLGALMTGTAPTPEA
jgi:hypothetical protein